MALLKFKRSAVPGKAPALGDLELGELALNTYDGKVFMKKDSGTASIVEVGGSSGGGTVTSVSGTGTVSGLTLTGNVTSSGSLTLGGTLTLTSGNVTTALGYTPYNSTNPAGYITSSALTPYALLSGAAFTGNVTTTGNVGIGTTASSDRLNVSGSGQFTNATYCFVGVTSGTVQGQFAANAGGTLDIRAVSNHSMTLFTNNTERMRIDSIGRVGIGTSAPAATLDVGGGLIAGGENRQTHPNAGVGFKAQWNYTSGDGETDFYNLYGSGTTSFRFYQTTGNGTAQLLYNMRPTTHEFYTGGTLRFSITSTGGITSSDLADAVGYKGLPQNQRTSAYTLALSDIGKHLYVTAGAFAVTIPADGTLNFPVGAAITFVCEDAGKTIVPASGVALVLAGTGAATTGTRTLAIGAVATLIKVQANRWYISGAGVT